MVVGEYPASRINSSQIKRKLLLLFSLQQHELICVLQTENKVSPHFIPNNQKKKKEKDQIVPRC